MPLQPTLLSDLPSIRPFLKWPGGKYRLISRLKSHLPQGSYLIEPFVGAGALFLNTQYQSVVLNDINPDLINVFQQLQNHGKKFIGDARKLFVSKNNQSTIYYRFRARFNQSNDLWERALLFLYMNRHGYNGLCRFNLKGGFNVPFGNYRHPYFPEKELASFYQRSKLAKFYCQHYTLLLEQFLKHPELDKMVFYCDPPYAPLSKTANFTGYAAWRFTLEDQRELAKWAKKLKKGGATVLISNHDTPFTREIYRGAKIQQFEVSRTISCQVNARHPVKEIIACYLPS